MKSSKIITIILMFLLTLGTVTAIGYDVSIDVFPAHNDFDGVLVQNGEEFLVFGYVYDSEWLYAINPSEIRITVMDEDRNIIDTFMPEYVSNDRAGSNVLGYFFKEVEIYDAGEYTIRINAGSLARTYRYVQVSDSAINRKISVNLLDYSIEGNAINFNIRLKNEDASAQTITVYLKGENNFDAPITFRATLAAGETRNFEKSYALSDFGEGKFLVVAQAYVQNSKNKRLMSKHDYLQVGGPDGQINQATGGTSIKITNVTLSENVYFPEDIVEGKVYIKNFGNSASQYSFEYVYDNIVFKKGDVGVVHPGQTAEENFFFIVPDKQSIEMIFRVTYGNTCSEYKRVLLVSEKTKFFLAGLEKSEFVVDAGKPAGVSLKIMNTGNLDDLYTITVSDWTDYIVDDSSFVSGGVFLKAGTHETTDILFNVPKEIRADTYSPKITVCNTADLCYTRMPTIRVYKPEVEQNTITWDESLEETNYTEIESFEYEFSVKNMGSSEKSYEIQITAPEALNYTIDKNIFELDMDKEQTVLITLSPEELADYTAKLRVYSNDELIFEKELNLNYQDKEKTGITGFMVRELGEPYVPALVVLALIGAGFLSYLSYTHLSKKVWTEKVLNYTPRQKPQVYRQAQNSYPRSKTTGDIHYN